MPAPSERKTEPAILEDWGSFKLGMLQNQAYQRVSQASTDKLSVSRIETFFSIQGEELQAAVMLWEAMMKGVEEEVRPSAFEAGQWRAIARATHMPITFNEEGFLEEL